MRCVGVAATVSQRSCELFSTAGARIVRGGSLLRADRAVAHTGIRKRSNTCSAGQRAAPTAWRTWPWFATNVIRFAVRCRGCCLQRFDSGMFGRSSECWPIVTAGGRGDAATLPRRFYPLPLTTGPHLHGRVEPPVTALAGVAVDEATRKSGEGKQGSAIADSDFRN